MRDLVDARIDLAAMEWEFSDDEEVVERLLAAAPKPKRRARALLLAGSLVGAYIAAPLVMRASSLYGGSEELVKRDAGAPAYDTANVGAYGWQTECSTALQTCATSAEEPALGGADVVAYFGGETAAGVADFSATYAGAYYWFSSAENRDRFLEAPADFAPRVGGFCAYALTGSDRVGVECGIAVNTVSPDEFSIVEGRLYVFKGARARGLMGEGRDLVASVAAAEAHWATLLEIKEVDAAAAVNSNSADCVAAVAAHFAGLPWDPETAETGDEYAGEGGRTNN